MGDLQGRSHIKLLISLHCVAIGYSKEDSLSIVKNEDQNQNKVSLLAVFAVSIKKEIGIN